ncbi:conjugal transfer protein TrbH [uncultured Azohydromonas sp.]|jgi:Conjugal transfer protein TrbH.|uniref:conjugal transfer protein TrbH n=1 Tax=uncultured Azohydromonas sp. TaxID=487342 RepID=UPI00260F93C0|nr:conjugal transfer protein TrbH [uncultured Azohydromonas sp.]
MNNILTAAVFALVLAGCATSRTEAPQGNYLPAGIDQPRLAADAVRQLVAVYPPARTRLVLEQPAKDAFGAALLQGLRASGYAVQEGGKAPEDTLPLRYVADQAGPVFRVMVAVGSQSLARAYVPQGNALVPAGAWARKE